MKKPSKRTATALETLRRAALTRIAGGLSPRSELVVAYDDLSEEDLTRVTGGITPRSELLAAYDAAPDRVPEAETGSEELGWGILRNL